MHGEVPGTGVNRSGERIGPDGERRPVRRCVPDAERTSLRRSTEGPAIHGDARAGYASLGRVQDASLDRDALDELVAQA